jgi:peptidoglycan/xylan/chitin deacetylase (PgdA/CDA1 family)
MKGTFGATTAMDDSTAEHEALSSTVVTVLMYHDVVDATDPDASGFPGPSAASYKVDVSRFEQHLAAVTAWDQVGAPDVAVDRQGAHTVWRLTFDDGGVSAISSVADLLEQRQWRGMFFVTTDRIGKSGFLSDAHVRELRDRGHIIGSHTRSHPVRLAACTRADIRAQWRDSIEALSELLGEPITVASVPNGSYDRVVAEEAEAAGIRVLFTSDPTRRRRRIGRCLVVGRYSVRANTSAAWVAAVAHGARLPRYKQWIEWRLKRLAERSGHQLYDQVRRTWLARYRQ